MMCSCTLFLYRSLKENVYEAAHRRIAFVLLLGYAAFPRPVLHLPSFFVFVMRCLIY